LNSASGTAGRSSCGDGNEASSSVTPGRWTLTTWTSRPVIVQEAGYPRGATQIVRGGQGKAINIHRIYSDSGGGNELMIVWTAEGESIRRTWVEPIPS